VNNCLFRGSLAEGLLCLVLGVVILLNLSNVFSCSSSICLSAFLSSSSFICSSSHSQETVAGTIEKVWAVAVGKARGILYSEKAYLDSVRGVENQKSRYFIGPDCLAKATEWLKAQWSEIRTTSERREYQAFQRAERMQRRAQQQEKEPKTQDTKSKIECKPTKDHAQTQSV